MNEKNLRFRIKGTPSQFRAKASVAIELIMADAEDDGILFRVVDDFKGASENLVKVAIYHPKAGLPGWATAMARDGESSELFVGGAEDDLPYIEESWELLRTQMTQLGLVVDDTPSVSSVNQAEPVSLIHEDPWDSIPDHAWDRTAVQLWHQRKTAKEIAHFLRKSSVRVEPTTVTNRLSHLRTTEKGRYARFVPTDEERKRHIAKRILPPH